MPTISSGSLGWRSLERRLVQYQVRRPCQNRFAAEIEDIMLADAIVTSIFG